MLGRSTRRAPIRHSLLRTRFVQFAAVLAVIFAWKLAPAFGADDVVYGSPTARGLKLQLRELCGTDDARRAQRDDPASAQTLPSDIEKIAGLWRWKTPDAIQDDSATQPGGLLFVRRDGQLQGFTLVETTATDRNSKRRHLLLSSPIRVESVTRNPDGEVLVAFEVESVKGFRTKSSAVLSADGKHLSGLSTTTASPSAASHGYTATSYRWDAERSKPRSH